MGEITSFTSGYVVRNSENHWSLLTKEVLCKLDIDKFSKMEGIVIIVLSAGGFVS